MTEKSKINSGTNLQKAFFKFDCTVQDGKIRLALKQTNINTPYYYEAFFTLEELCQKNSCFKACKNLEDAQKHLLALFQRDRTSLKSLEDNKKIEINFVIYLFCIEENVNFILDRKQ